MPYLFQLAKKGYGITILSCEKKDRIEKDGADICNTITEAGIKWHPILFHNSIPVISKIYDRFLLKKKAFELHKKEKFDLVHCRSYISSEVGLAMKQNLRVKFIFDMRGFWADEKKDSKHWNVANPLYKFIYRHYKQLEKKLLHEADAIVVLTHAAKEEIMHWSVAPEIPKKIHVVPCCADLSHFSEEKIDLQLQANLKEELGLTNAHPVLCYLGSIGDSYAVDEMLYFFSQLKKKYNAAKFLFFTKDAAEAVTDKLKIYSNLSTSDIVVRFVQRKDLPTYLSLCTFSVFFYVPTYSRIACSPTKFAEISGLGLPVICNAVGDLNKQFLQGLPHIVINDLNNKTIDDSIALVKQFEHLDKSSIRNFVQERYNLTDGVRKYLSIYNSLTV
jgi:glycosyltransferase involved in cell wall biosynthesis